MEYPDALPTPSEINKYLVQYDETLEGRESVLSGEHRILEVNPDGSTRLEQIVKRYGDIKLSRNLDGTYDVWALKQAPLDHVSEGLADAALYETSAN